MASLNAALNFLSLPSACPFCVVALDPKTGRAIAANSTFESVMGPLYKFTEWEFANAAAQDDANPDAAPTTGEGGVESNRTVFREAINKVRTSLRDDGMADAGEETTKKGEATTKIRNVEMLTLGTNEAGLPIRKYFDWTIGSVRLEDEGDGAPSAVLLYGDMVNEEESSDRARDAELIDFFQNAPIAMHWLNGDGTVLWANQTEMNLLGYAPEEYIGQQIMKFCPDEKELVLEIFKQLGSGNAIADVPVRFRTKDGKIVHLLIDSNVAYNKDGLFGHTRCFIRDDTARKIRDARTKLLLDENERSLRMFDTFLSRTLHHVMGPLHALRGTCEVVSDRLRQDKIDEDEKEKNCMLLDRAVNVVTTSTRMVADVGDLARFDEGSTLKIKKELVGLRDVGLEALDKIQFSDLRLKGGDDNITVSLSLVGEGGPSAIQTDRVALLRVLAHLLENAVREVDSGGNVTLQVTSSRSKGVVLVEVIDDGKGLSFGTCLDKGGESSRLAPIHRYATAGKQSDHPDELMKVRAEMEAGLQDLKQNGVGVGLPLSYHLVRMLGGELRHDTSTSEGTRIWFALPHNVPGDEMEEGDEDALNTETIRKKGLVPTHIAFTSEQSNKRQRTDDAKFGNFVVSSDSDSSTSAESVKSSFASTADPAPQAVAKCGVKASLPFSVLIVEDTDICARLLAMQLKKMGCSTQRAENGQIAVDLLKDSLPGTFDLVLMDLRMPVMDGLEATKLIRNELNMGDLPILALTGEMKDEIRNECAGVGFTEFFQKPLPKKKLQELVDKYKAAVLGQ